MSVDLMLGQAARRLGVDLWALQRLIERRLYGPVRRVGRYRVLGESELPAVEAALRAAGYLLALPEEPAPAQLARS